MTYLLFGCIFLCSMVVVGCSDPANQKNSEARILTTDPAKENRMPGQYIVTLKEGASTETLTEVFHEYGIISIKELTESRYLIILEQDPGQKEITTQAATSLAIEHVQPNYFYRTMPLIQQDRQQPQ